MKFVPIILLCIILLLTSCGQVPSAESIDVEDTSVADTASATTTTAADQSVTSGTKHTNASGTTTGGADNVVVSMDWGDDDTTTAGSSAPTTTTTTTTAVPVATVTTVASGMHLPAAGFSLDGKLQVAQASAKGNLVTLVFRNATQKFETDRDSSTVTYVCLDKAGKELATGQFSPGRIHAGKEGDAISVTVPSGTEELRLTAFDIEYWTDGFH